MVDVAFRLNLSQAKALKIVDAVLDSLTTALVKGDRVVFHNFGVFEVVVRKSKIGRNPQRPDDGPYLVPARRLVKFRMGKELLEQLNPET